MQSLSRISGLLIATISLVSCANLAPAPREQGNGLDSQASRLILVTIAAPDAAVPFDAGSTPHVYAAPRPYPVRARRGAAALAREYGLRMVREWPIAALKVDCMVYALPPGRNRAAVLAQLARDSRVKLSEPLQLFNTRAAATATAIAAAAPVAATAPAIGTHRGDDGGALTYDDPYFALQTGFVAIGADRAQRRSRGDGVRVAIIDTGVDVDHPDMVPVAIARDFFQEDAAQFRRDRHGTAVAGIIAAVANNRLGIAGVAPGVRLQIYKACEPLAPGVLAAQCNSFTLALALGAAIDARAQIVNLSLSGPSDALLAALVVAGQHRRMVFIGADPGAGGMPGFPLDIPGVIAVDEAGGVISPGVVLRAPGRDVLSLAPAGHYDYVSGSSFAAAYVTAAAALLKARAPQLSAAALLAALTQTQQRDGGLINVCAALTYVLGGPVTATCAVSKRDLAAVGPAWRSAPR
jgi:subtilisin family serine protease